MKANRQMNQDSKFYVYKHTSPYGKVYIGITCKKPERRWLKGYGYRKNKHFHDAIEKYGWDNFKHELIFSGLSQDDAYKKEVELIAKYNSNNKLYGYNISSGGDGANGCYFSEERKEEYRKMFSGENNPFYGKRHDKETIQKIKDSRVNKNWNYFEGHHHSEEFKIYKSKQMHEKYSNGNNPRAKVVIEYNKECNELNRYFSLCDCSRKTGISKGYISRLCHNDKCYQGKRYAFSER